MATIYYEKDADLKLLKDKTIGVIGFGANVIEWARWVSLQIGKIPLLLI